MKTIKLKYIGALVFAGLMSSTAMAQGDELLNNLLMNDCSDPAVDKILIDNAEDWQDDLVHCAMEGPRAIDIENHKEYLEKRFDKNQEALQTKDYAWVTPEIKAKLNATSKAEFVEQELTNYVLKYKQQANYGLNLLKSNNKLSESMDIELAVTPNPASEEVSVKLDVIESSDVTVALLNLDGSLVSETTLSSVSGAQTIKLNVAEVATGTYLVRVMTSVGKINTKRLVVNH